MPDPKIEGDGELLVDEVEVDEPKRRGAPRKSPDERKSEKIVISVTPVVMRRMMLVAANVEPVPQHVKEWAEWVLLDALAAAERKP